KILNVQCEARRTGVYPWVTHGGVFFSRNGQTLYTASSPVLQAWDRAAGRPRYSIRFASDVHVVTLSPDEKFLAVVSDDRFVRYFDNTTGREIGRRLEHPVSITDVAFSPDGKLLC